SPRLSDAPRRGRERRVFPRSSWPGVSRPPTHRRLYGLRGGPTDRGWVAGTRPAMTERAMTERARTERAVTERAVTERARTERARTEMAMTERAVTERARTERAGGKAGAAISRQRRPA